MENITQSVNKNLLLLSASAIFFFLSVTIISEFTSRFVRDLLLHFNVDFWLIFVISTIINFALIIFGILSLKNVLLNSKILDKNLFKFSIFILIFCQLLYVANPFLYHLLDIEHMNTQWVRYAKFTSDHLILSILNFSVTIFSYLFLGFIFLNNRNSLIF